MKWLSEDLLEIHIIINHRKISAVVNRFFIKRLGKIYLHNILTDKANKYYVLFMRNTKATYPLCDTAIDGPYYEIPQYEYDQLNNLGQPVTMSNTTRYC